MAYVLQALSVLFMATFKFLITGLYSFSMGFSYLETLLFTMIGGMAGATGIYMLGTRVLEWFRKRYVRKREARIAKGVAPRRIFTRTNRTIVKVKHRYGVVGLVAIAPPILSIPITSLLAAKYFRHERRTLPVLLGSICIWSIVLTTMWGFFR
ncbi:MAG: hypothetical protein KDC00_05175 [Flavobacteriales bacterium]|nr:hypothetical protein [Flavobacteriales bacterium]